MNYLALLTGVLLALGVTMSVILAVVCLLMGLNLDARPGLRAEWPLLMQSTLLFVAITIPIAVAWWSLRRRLPWWPAAQVTMWVAVVIAALVFRILLVG